MRTKGSPDGGSPAASRAPEWVMRMHSGLMSQADERELREWLAESAAHSRDLLRTETVWRVSGALAGAPEVQAELAILRQSPQRSKPWATALLSRWHIATATVILFAASAAAWFGVAQMATWYETLPGEQRIIPLADGSIVALNTNSRVGVDYDADQRTVQIERGEALFQVAEDPLRPFIVHAASGYVRAFGTRFNVLVEDQEVTITVLDGHVEVAARRSSAGPGAHKLLDAHQSAAYALGGLLVEADPTRASIDRIVAWREGRLRFDGWPLERAIHEHNRYAAKPIRLGAAEIAQTRISGIFRVGDTEALVRALSSLINVQAIDHGDELLLVRSRPGAVTHEGDSQSLL